VNAKTFHSRILKLEQYRAPRPPYVLRVSTPQKSEETQAINAALAAGRRFAVLPRKITMQEWIDLHLPRGRMQ
jgi:hypothetical protein